MRNARSLTAVLGSMFLAITLTAGMAVAQSGSADSPKDSTSQPAQPAQPSQPNQSSQPSAPAQAAPDAKQSDSRTDVRTESRSERVVVETERTKMFVICPSTCGMIAADPRDLSVATYSLLSSTATDLATWILTGMAGGAGGGTAWHARTDKASARTGTMGFGKDLCIGAGERT